jgi:hypothetical protein
MHHPAFDVELFLHRDLEMGGADGEALFQIPVEV